MNKRKQTVIPEEVVMSKIYEIRGKKRIKVQNEEYKLVSKLLFFNF